MKQSSEIPQELTDSSEIETTVKHNYEEIIIAIHDHCKVVFAKAQMPVVTDKSNTFSFQRTKPTRLVQRILKPNRVARRVREKMSFKS